MLAAERTVFVLDDMTTTSPCIPVWIRRGQTVSPTSAYGRQLEGFSGGALGIDIPGVDTMLTAGKAIFYVGIGSAIIVASMFAWRLIDTVLPE